MGSEKTKAKIDKIKVAVKGFIDPADGTFEVAKDKIEVTVKGLIDPVDGTFEVFDVPGWTKSELGNLGNKRVELGSVGMQTMYISSSPGHWCLIGGRWKWIKER